jgi:asparagine synthase (glutamine-hydrolysing)
MCGFAGILNFHHPLRKEEIAPILHSMGDQIAYRGPDDEQLFCDQSIGMVFRRLSIVDLVGGVQPMSNEDDSLMLVLNGEIYNHEELKPLLKDQHHFKSRSDCEIVLHLYEEMGVDFLLHLNGMFSLALWDRRNRKLILARDRLGIKPLYYSINKERVLFGSEIKALMPYPDCPREYDWEHALSGSNHNHAAQDFTIHSYFKGIENLPGGKYLVVDLQGQSIEEKCYWRLSPLTMEEYADDQRSDQEIIDGYREVLEDSVRLQLMADVELGLFLSGGIDSVVVALIASRYQKFHTFSVLSQSTFKNGDARAAHVAAKYLGLQNHQVQYPWHNHTFDSSYWKKLLWTCETFECGAEQLYKSELHRYAKHHRPGLKIILTGQGSDEFNGGYVNQFIDMGPEYVEDKDRNWKSFERSLSHLEKDQLLRAAPGLGYFSRCINKGFIASVVNQPLWNHPWFYYGNRSLRSLQMYNLWHEDRISAGNHIENRVPFLDHRLVEYTMRVPPAKYDPLFWNKNVLRSAFKDALPEELAQRPKCPFFHGPDERYTNRMMYNILISDDRALIREAFGETGTHHEVIDRSAIEKMLAFVPDDPAYGDVPDLLKLTNMALLEKMAMKAAFKKPVVFSDTAVLDSIQVSNWDAEEDAIAATLSIRRQAIDLDAKVALRPEVTFLKGVPAGWFLAVDEAIKYCLDEAENKDWIEVLQQINGERSINSIVAELNMPASRIRKNLEEAMDYNIIQFGNA